MRICTSWIPEPACGCDSMTVRRINGDVAITTPSDYGSFPSMKLQRPMPGTRTPLHRIWISALALLAVLASAYAHDPAARDPMEIALERAEYVARYALPDGTVPVRCHDLDGDHAAHDRTDCTFCLLNAGAPVPDGAGAPVHMPAVATSGGFVVFNPDLPRRDLYRLNGACRAPPTTLA